MTASDATRHLPQSIAFPNQLVKALRKAAQTEQALEEARKARREKRLANGSLSEAGGSSTASGNMAVAGTSGLLGERAPDIDTKKTSSKKEQKRQAEAKATEAQQHAATNKTMNMALSLGGVMGKKLSWMTKDSPSSNSGFPVLPRASSAPHGQAKNLASGPGTHKAQGLSRKSFGDFREDRETGAGIQMRDVVAILEPEPKERKSLARAYSRMGSKK